MIYCAEDSARYSAKLQKKAAPEFSFPEPLVLCAKIIMAVALAFLLVVSASRLLAVLVPDHDRLRQADHRAAAAAAAVAAGAVAAEAADH